MFLPIELSLRIIFIIILIFTAIMLLLLCIFSFLIKLWLFFFWLLALACLQVKIIPLKESLPFVCRLVNFNRFLFFHSIRLKYYKDLRLPQVFDNSLLLINLNNKKSTDCFFLILNCLVISF
jgi:hypothetical protein